jgi:hypothetical protein
MSSEKWSAEQVRDAGNYAGNISPEWQSMLHAYAATLEKPQAGSAEPVVYISQASLDHFSKSLKYGLGYEQVAAACCCNMPNGDQSIPLYIVQPAAAVSDLTQGERGKAIQHDLDLLEGFARDDGSNEEIEAVKTIREAVAYLVPRGEVGGPEGWTRAEAKLHERKTVHEWLNELHIEREEFGKPLCLLRRLRILCDRYADTCKQLSFEIRKQIGWVSTDASTPERNSSAIYWHRSPHGGFPAIADEWRDEHHLMQASHWLPYSAPHPKEAKS